MENLYKTHITYEAKRPLLRLATLETETSQVSNCYHTEKGVNQPRPPSDMSSEELRSQRFIRLYKDSEIKLRKLAKEKKALDISRHF